MTIGWGEPEPSLRETRRRAGECDLELSADASVITTELGTEAIERPGENPVPIMIGLVLGMS
jgi:hypothetical protein